MSILGDSPAISLLLISSFISLLSEGTLCTIYNILNVIRHVVWSRMSPIVANVLVYLRGVYILPLGSVVYVC